MILFMQKLDFLQERIISLAFDVISHVLETGPVNFFCFVVHYSTFHLVFPFKCLLMKYGLNLDHCVSPPIRFFG